ncbi:hypothetical protein LIER_30914 [Lithospermum erythrorhizon]|uniref:Uncharacterized protein n=1 Tax=Lithospermum erythrorhizon TaxID=34254 RepID=A0AAV3RR57_LITER
MPNELQILKQVEPASGAPSSEESGFNISMSPDLGGEGLANSQNMEATLSKLQIQKERGEDKAKIAEESSESWSPEPWEGSARTRRLRPRKNTLEIRINEERARVQNKRIPKNVPDVVTKGITFHAENGRARWNYVFQRRIAVEKKLSDKVKRNLMMMEIFAQADVKNFVETINN